MNEQNLRPFKKGTSGNPSGRPRGSKNVTTEMRLLLKRIAPDAVIETPIIRAYCGHLKRVTNAHAIAARLIYDASLGNVKAMKELIDRDEGKARQAIELGGIEGGEPLEIIYRVIYENESPAE